MTVKYRKDIQVLRGLAVFAVVLFHADESHFPLGYLGVDAFFVISGFVVTPLILRIFEEDLIQGRRLANLVFFYKRRFYRLAPALSVTLVFSGVIVFFFGPISDHQRFARQGIATLFLGGNIGAQKYSGDYFSPNPNPLVHTWSLSVEEQIYLFLPLVLMLLINNHRYLKKLTAVVFVFITSMSFITFQIPEISQQLYSRVSFLSPSIFAFYSPVDRLWQFTLGGLGCLVLIRSKWRVAKIPRVIDLFLICSLLIVLFGTVQMSLKVSSTLVSLLVVIVIVSRSLELLPNFIIKKFEWIGDRSYSIYLVHLPLLYIAKYSPMTKIGNSENRIIQSLVAVCVSVAIGSICYSKIENKYRKRGDCSSNNKSITLALILTLFLPLILFVSLDRSTLVALPSSGMPTPGLVLPWDWDENCQVESLNSKVNSSPCKYGDASWNHSILLIGDSHAASVSRAVIALGNTNNMRTFVFTFQGCGFIKSEYELDVTYRYPYLTKECLEHNDAILRLVSEIQPSVIIWAHRSSSTMVSPNNVESRTRYNKMIARNLLSMTDKKNILINIGSGPEFIPISTWTEVLLKRKSYFSKIPFEDNIFWKSRNATGYYLDSLKILCPGNSCLNKSGEGWLFHDSDHLSELGANLLKPKLDYMIKIILNSDLKSSESIPEY